MLSHQTRDRQEVFIMTKEASAEATIRNICRKTRRKYTAEENIRIVLEGIVISPSLNSAAGKA